MALLMFPKGDSQWLTRNFRAFEFDCPCAACSQTLIESKLVSLLQILRERANRPMQITSGFRCSNHQHELDLAGYETARGISTHTLGMAADLCMGGMPGSQMEQMARMAGFHAVGMGHTFIHVDLRSDKERRWFYTIRG